MDADAAILDLQATAGNRAVTELLGPMAGDVAIQRDTTDGTPAAEPTDTSTATGNTMSIPDLKLSVPVESVQTAVNGADRGTSGRGSREQTTSGEVVVMFRAEHLSPALFAAVAQGQQFAVVTITIRSSTLDAPRRRDLGRAEGRRDRLAHPQLLVARVQVGRRRRVDAG